MYYLQRLKDLREDRDLSQSDIAKKLKTTQPQYSKYESGERNLSASSFAIACRVLKALELDIYAYARGDYVISEETVDILFEISNKESNK